MRPQAGVGDLNHNETLGPWKNMLSITLSREIMAGHAHWGSGERGGGCPLEEIRGDEMDAMPGYGQTTESY